MMHLLEKKTSLAAVPGGTSKNWENDFAVGKNCK